MPGIYGVVSRMPRAVLPTELAEMARRLKHHPWYHEDRHADGAAGLGMGRVSLGFVNTAAQPAANEDRSLLAVMEGEVYDYEEQRRELAGEGHRFAGGSHAELLLHGYEARGPRFFRDLHGAFAAALWDARKRQLVLVSDRFGMRPLYYARLEGRLVFASEIKALLADPEVSRRLDPRGVAQFFTFGQLLGEDTLLATTRLLPAAACLIYSQDHENLRIENYWRPEVGSPDGCRGEEQVLDAIDAAFGRAVDRCTRGEARLGLSLSGGLDARTILGVIPPDRAVTTVCLGMEGSLDHRCAEEMARLAGRPHHRHVLDTKFLDDFEEHLRHDVYLTDGHFLCQCIVMPTLPLYRELGIQVLLRGHAGELLHLNKAYNFSLDAAALGLRGGAALEEWLFHRLGGYTCLHEAAGARLFSAAYRGEFDGLARQSLRDCLAEWEGVESVGQKVSGLFLRQRLRRETALSMREFGSLVETRIPYLDNELVDAVLAAPVGLKLGDTIQRHILARRMPPFLNIVNANTGARMGAGRLTRAFSELRMRVLAKLGVRGYQPYERLGRWLREGLRPLVENLLLGERCLGRGVFDPEALRAVVDGHLNKGRNHTYLLLALMTFELGQRMLCDGDGFAANGHNSAAGERPLGAATSPLVNSTAAV